MSQTQIVFLQKKKQLNLKVNLWLQRESCEACGDGDHTRLTINTWLIDLWIDDTRWQSVAVGQQWTEARLATASHNDTTGSLWQPTD